MCKLTKLFAILSVIFFLAKIEVSAQSIQMLARDSLFTAVKIRKLESDLNSLKNQITIEESKRNLKDANKTPTELESINYKQDSICLVLYSKCLSIELELKELLPSKIDKLINFYKSIKKNIIDTSEKYSNEKLEDEPNLVI